MYVIFPAEDVVELTLARPSPPRLQHHCPCQCAALKRAAAEARSLRRISAPGQPSAAPSTRKELAASKAANKKEGKQNKANKKDKAEKNVEMAATGVNECSLKDVSHPTCIDQLKAYNTATFKLVKTVSDFSQDFSRLCEEHATNLQQLVTNYRKRNTDLRKERPNCQSSLFQLWETLLQEVEADSQAQGDVATVFARQISRPLLDRSFHRKVQASKILTNRDKFEHIMKNAEEKLTKCRQEYKAAYLAHLSSPNSAVTLSGYIDAHNAYVKLLNANNSMVELYTKETLPALLQELENVYSDLCVTVSDSLLQGAESISTTSTDRVKRFENVSSQCRATSPSADISYFVKHLSPLPGQATPSHRLRMFMHPTPPNAEPEPGSSNSEYPTPAEQLAQIFPKNELVTEHMSTAEVKEKHDQLRMEGVKLEAQIKQHQDSLDQLLRMLQRSLETSLFNKANELQEDISGKRYELQIAQIHLAAIRAQKELFNAKLDSLDANARDRKLSAASNASMKSKWLKAFKSLKSSGPSNGSVKDSERKSAGREGFQITNSPDLVHQFQEYTYKKITPCDLCSQVLRGHTRQGLKCRLCKMNVHLDCQEKVTTRCQTKSRLLRRQKSTSEIETRIVANMPEEEGYEDNTNVEIDSTYQIIRQANEIKSMPARITAPAEPPRKAWHPLGNVASHVGQSSLNVASPPIVSSSAPHSPRRHKINWRMKSVSLDSSEPPDYCQPKCSVVGSTASIEPHSSHSSTSRLQSPSSPVHNRRLLSARPMRMSSVELPDEIEKSASSASNSPTPSPMKTQRLLPTNLYVVLYNFEARHMDELDLKAGYKVTVIERGDHDWWKGKCLGRVGYFPSQYVTRLQSGERVLQVMHNLQVTAADSSDKGLTLLRDQIVIQVGEEIAGMIMFRNGDNQQGVCPVKYLQEV